MADPMDLYHGLILGLGLEQLPRVLQALHKVRGGAGGGQGNASPGAAPGGSGEASPGGIPGLEGVDPSQLLPLLMPLLQANMAQQQQAGPVPGMPPSSAPGGTLPGMASAAPALPPPPPLPTMGRLPVTPRVLPMSAGVSY